MCKDCKVVATAVANLAKVAQSAVVRKQWVWMTPVMSGAKTLSSVLCRRSRVLCVCRCALPLRLLCCQPNKSLCSAAFLKPVLPPPVLCPCRCVCSPTDTDTASDCALPRTGARYAALLPFKILLWNSAQRKQSRKEGQRHADSLQRARARDTCTGSFDAIAKHTSLLSQTPQLGTRAVQGRSRGHSPDLRRSLCCHRWWRAKCL